MAYLQSQTVAPRRWRVLVLAFGTVATAALGAAEYELTAGAMSDLREDHIGVVRGSLGFTGGEIEGFYLERRTGLSLLRRTGGVQAPWFTVGPVRSSGGHADLRAPVPHVWSARQWDATALSLAAGRDPPARLGAALRLPAHLGSVWMTRDADQRSAGGLMRLPAASAASSGFLEVGAVTTHHTVESDGSRWSSPLPVLPVPRSNHVLLRGAVRGLSLNATPGTRFAGTALAGAGSLLVSAAPFIPAALAGSLLVEVSSPLGSRRRVLLVALQAGATGPWFLSADGSFGLQSTAIDARVVVSPWRVLEAESRLAIQAAGQPADIDADSWSLEHEHRFDADMQIGRLRVGSRLVVAGDPRLSELEANVSVAQSGVDRVAARLEIGGGREWDGEEESESSFRTRAAVSGRGVEVELDGGATFAAADVVVVDASVTASATVCKTLGIGAEIKLDDYIAGMPQTVRQAVSLQVAGEVRVQGSTWLLGSRSSDQPRQSPSP